MLCDYHIHSTYCDGKSTLRESIEKALSLGMEVIGFSGHSYIENATYCMTRKGTEAYVAELSSLKDEFSDRITVLCGLEKDYYSDEDESKFDYVIGSLHYVLGDGVMFDVDYKPQYSLDVINKYFSSDPLSFCEHYYSTLGRLFDNVKADIIGHFDLITKFSECGLAFDTADRRYISAATDAIDALLPHHVPFEINTGAMSRGYRTSPYPSKEILRYISSRGGCIILTSDCHNADNLCFEFDKAKAIAKACGFKSLVVFTEKGKNEIEL